MRKEGTLKRLILIEDDDLFLEAMRDYLSDRYSIQVAKSAEHGSALLHADTPDVVLLDIHLPGQDGIQLLKEIRSKWPELPVIMLTAVDRIQTVVECMKLGAVDYLPKPVIAEELLASLRRVIEATEIRKELQLRRDLQLMENREYRLLGESSAIQTVRKQIEVVARTDSPVLIVGETGTGKEVAAREIHARSPRAEGPFVAVNCGAIPKDLFETEFFGYKKGAFTGAQSTETGKFQLSHRGTLLLDEIGELPLSTQTKLLRVLEEQEFYPVGSTQLVRIDVRVIASTNRSLEQMVQQKQFREDLYFRLNVYAIEMPPLRYRADDIEVLTKRFMELFNRKFGKNFQTIERKAMDALLAYPWKGNVRELRNVMERVVLSEDGDTIEKEHLFKIPGFTQTPPAESPFSLPEGGLDLEEVEKTLIIQALRKTNGNKTKAAKLLNLSPPTLYYRLEKFGLS